VARLTDIAVTTHYCSPYPAPCLAVSHCMIWRSRRRCPPLRTSTSWRSSWRQTCTASSTPSRWEGGCRPASSYWRDWFATDAASRSTPLSSQPLPIPAPARPAEADGRSPRILLVPDPAWPQVLALGQRDSPVRARCVWHHSLGGRGRDNRGYCNGWRRRRKITWTL